MPLQKMQLRPGINKEGTNYSNEGGWYNCDKVRFRSGNPEKIGGWSRYADTQLIGTARSLWNWVDNNNNNWLSIGTNSKFYLENGGSFYDITPVKFPTETAPASKIWYTAGYNPPNTNNCFYTNTGSNIVTVSITGGHNATINNYVTFIGVTGTYAAQLNKEFKISSIINTSQFTIELATNASSTGSTGGTAVYGAFQIDFGQDIYTTGYGWGAGPWGGGTSTGWGVAATTGGIPQQLRLWSVDNYGQDLVFAPRGGYVYYYPLDGRNVTRALPLYLQQTISYPEYSNTPKIANIVMCSAERFLVLMGTQEYGKENDLQTISPLLIRWSDQSNPYLWAPSITNQAGEYKLSHGSYIVQAVQTRQETLVFTDSSLYSMQYQGPPYVFGFNLLMHNISIMSPNSAYTVNGVTYWMGVDKFYMYSGTVETLTCTVKQYVFEDMNIDQGWQYFVGGNSGYNEVWWFYCSKYELDSNGYVILTDGSPTVNTKINKYVIYNYLDNTWYIGNMARSAWIDSGIKPFPIAVDYNKRVLYHENNVDDLSESIATPIKASITSSEFDIEDGQSFGYVWRILPDVNFNASTIANPKVYMSLSPRRNSGNPYQTSASQTITLEIGGFLLQENGGRLLTDTGMVKNITTSIPIQNVGYTAQNLVETINPTAVVSGNDYTYSPVFTIQEFTGQVYTRIRGRQCMFSMGSNDLGVAWQLGAVRLDIRPDGRR